MKILLLGDSIMSYMPSGLIGTEADEVIKHCYANMGVGTLHEYVWKEINIYDADLNILLIGINNILRPDCDYDDMQTLDDIVVKIIRLVQDISSNSSGELIVQALYPINKYNYKDSIDYINKKLKKYCNENDIDYLDLAEQLKDEQGLLKKEYSQDGLHPNSECYDVIAQHINDKTNALFDKKILKLKISNSRLK